MESSRSSTMGKVPLYVRVLIGVGLGVALGGVFGTGPIAFGLTNQDLGDLGMLVIRLLKALAVPLVLFAILDASLRTRITARSGRKLVLICLVNVSVAFLIGLTLMNTLRPGELWRGHLGEMQRAVTTERQRTPTASPAPVHPTLDPLKNVASYVPESLLEPFLRNNVITVVLIALLTGAAIRGVKEQDGAKGQQGVEVIECFVGGTYLVLVRVVGWVIQAVPFAVLGVVATAVGRSGLDVFRPLSVFLGVIFLGLALHALVYYPAAAWLAGGKPPREYLGRGADAIVTGLSTNSSLATVPVTLRVLTERLGVSHRSARLAVCVGTNLNNDGITLYEAMAALFLAQALGMNLGLPEQAAVVLAALMAGVGVAGIPEAGLVVLPLVLSAAGLPEATVAAAIPLILPVDWIIARARSGVNVMSDLLVAILLDRLDRGGDDAAAALDEAGENCGARRS